MSKIGFIGCGNMGGTLAKAAAKTDHAVYLSDYDQNKLNTVAKELNAHASTNEEIVSTCDLIFLGVKPQVLASVLEPLKGALKNRKDHFAVVSMAAGMTLETVAELAGGNYPVIRIMPNTPAAVESGMILYCKNGLVTDGDVALFLDSMQFAGVCDFIDEGLFDAATAVSGCGPAFCYMFVQALADGGVKAGLSKETALKLAAQTLMGAGKMVRDTGIDPETLKINVCSPGGSTIEGVKSLEADDLNGIVRKAVNASFKRTQELGKK